MVMNNKRGVTIIFGIMMFLFAVLIALAIVSPLKEITDDMRDSTHLNCDADNITTGVAISCITIDLLLPLFIATILGVGVVWITSRFGGE